jgi:hypothetical protein
MRHQIAGEVEGLVEGVGLINAEAEVLLKEIIVADPEAIAWEACVDCVCPIGEGVAHVLYGSGGGEEFWDWHGGFDYSE